MVKEPEVEVNRIKDAWEVDITLEGWDAFRITYLDDGRTEVFRSTWANLCRVAHGVINAIKNPPHSRN